MKKFLARVRQFVTKKEEGASMAEYGLLVALIAIVVIGAVTVLGTNLAAVFNNIAAAL